jgi:thiol:disulfide interchange protein DsbC
MIFSLFRLLRVVLTLVGVAWTSCCSVYAAEIETAQNQETVNVIHNLLVATQPGMVINTISPSPIAGLYKVVIGNGQTIFVSEDAKFLIPGDMYQVRPEGLVNLGEGERNKVRKDILAGLDDSDMIIFAAHGESKAVLSVFTDVDCPYCRKLHEEIDQLNDYGITVRYLAFPRTGLESETYHKMVSTWCANNPRQAFTEAKMGKDIPEVSCENPVAEQYELGRQLGVTGTPALVFDDGTIVPGYIPADTLAQYLLE